MFTVNKMAISQWLTHKDHYKYKHTTNTIMSFKNITVTEFKNKIESEADAVILDVRSEMELADGSVPNHILIDIMQPDFANKISELDKDKTYLVYCRSGNRSGKACALMGQMGFTKLYNLEGGIMAWNAFQ